MTPIDTEYLRTSGLSTRQAQGRGSFLMIHGSLPGSTTHGWQVFAWHELPSGPACQALDWDEVGGRKALAGGHDRASRHGAINHSSRRAAWAHKRRQ
jgi:hypothetical protein